MLNLPSEKTWRRKPNIRRTPGRALSSVCCRAKSCPKAMKCSGSMVPNVQEAPPRTFREMSIQWGNPWGNVSMFPQRKTTVVKKRTGKKMRSSYLFTRVAHKLFCSMLYETGCLGVNANTDRDQFVSPEIWWLKHVETSRNQCVFSIFSWENCWLKHGGKLREIIRQPCFFKCGFQRTHFWERWVHLGSRCSMTVGLPRISSLNTRSSRPSWILGSIQYILRLQLLAATSNDHFAIHLAIPLPFFGTCHFSNAKWLRRSRARLQHPPGAQQLHNGGFSNGFSNGFSMVDKIPLNRGC